MIGESDAVEKLLVCARGTIFQANLHVEEFDWSQNIKKRAND